MQGMEAKAAEAARVLRLLANENRLLLLCHLAGEGEASVNRLVALVGLSQPALSQHLAKLREDGLVAARRDAQQVFFRLAVPRVTALLVAMRAIFCPEDET